jgi:hypothetical protein
MKWAKPSQLADQMSGWKGASRHWRFGPLVAVLLDGAASDTIAAIKADCTVLEGVAVPEDSSMAKKLRSLASAPPL